MVRGRGLQAGPPRVGGLRVGGATVGGGGGGGLRGGGLLHGLGLLLGDELPPGPVAHEVVDHVGGDGRGADPVPLLEERVGDEAVESGLDLERDKFSILASFFYFDGKKNLSAKIKIP